MCECGVINKHLTTDVCPLDVGDCMWQHKKNNVCKFTHEVLTKEEFATRVGLPAIDDVTFEKRKHSMVEALKSGL